MELNNSLNNIMNNLKLRQVEQKLQLRGASPA
jgi:hypothetical protein